MHWIDWMIVFMPLLIVSIIALKTQKYNKSISDFLSAGRVAGRYVLSVSSGEASMGLISLVALLEAYYNSGEAYGFWQSGIQYPILTIMMLTGFCAYRYRESRAMTMGQFFEMRYSRSFRIFAGILQSISGILNYALFPAVGARFLVYFCGLPLEVTIFGFVFPTFALVMAIFLAIATIVVCMGGQITIMTADCILGILSYPMYIAVVGYIFYRFSFVNEMMPTLWDRDPGKSMINPFDIGNLRTFNLFYVFVGIIGGILNRMTWSGTQGFNSAAISAHEQKMAAVLGTWRSTVAILMFMMLGIVGYTVLNIDSDYLRKFVGNKIDVQKIKLIESDAVKIRNELAWKTLNDIAGEKKYADIRKEVRSYLDGKGISLQLQTNIDLVKAEEQKTEEQKRLRKIEKGITVPDTKTTAEKVSRQRPNREEMVSVTNYALKTMGADGLAKAQTFSTIFNQMRVTMTLKHILPIGIIGVFCALCVFMLIGCDTAYLHSWGSIIVQDVILPIRGKPLTPRQQLALLRGFIAGVAIFAFIFSFYFGQVDYILMFFAITGAIYCGGAGICILGGLYWKRGTTAGAWSALISGSLFATSTIIVQKIWAPVIYPWLDSINMVPTVAVWLEKTSAPFEPYILWRMNPDSFPINSQESLFVTMVLSVGLYFIISLLTCRKPFNMDRLLHRGEYQREGKAIEHKIMSVKDALMKMVGINQEYSKGDKVLAWSVFFWMMGWGFAMWLVVVIWNYISPWPYQYWVNWQVINLVAIGVVAVVSAVWFTIGGVWDLRLLFKRLTARDKNILDDGRVIGNISADDIELVEKVEHIDITEAHRQERILRQILVKENDNKHIEKPNEPDETKP